MSQVFAAGENCVCLGDYTSACMCMWAAKIKCCWAATAFYIHAEPVCATWWLVFAKTLSHVSLSDTPFEKHTGIQYTNEVGLHILMHYHMYIHRSVFKCTHIQLAVDILLNAELNVTNCLPSPKDAISSFNLAHSCQTPQGNWSVGTTGLTQQEALWLSVYLYSLQGERKEKVL